MTTNGNEERPLPDGWKWTTIKEITEKIQYGHTESAQAEPVGPKFLRITDIQNGRVDWDSVPYCTCTKEEHQKYVLHAGDIVFARTGATTGKSFLISNCPDAVFASYLIRLRVPPSTNSKYLSYFFQTPFYWSQIMTVRKGSAQPGVNATKLAELNVPLAPFVEQERIVAEIEKHFTRLDKAVLSLRRLQEKLARYKASILKAACGGRLVPQDENDEPASELLARILAERRAQWEAANPKKKYKEPTRVDTVELPELPDGWVWVTMPQIGELNRGKSKHRPRNDARLFGGPYPFIQTGEIRQADGFIATYIQTYSEFGLAQSRLWPSGTLCITIAANIAETAILSLDACFPDSVVGFIPVENGINVRFLEYYFRTVQSRLEEFAPATAQKNINLQTLSELAVPLPPLAEQKRIIAEVERRLSVVISTEQVIAANLARAERLRQSILHWAFTGRLV